jgi:hypothetical protein
MTQDDFALREPHSLCNYTIANNIQSPTFPFPCLLPEKAQLLKPQPPLTHLSKVRITHLSPKNVA